MAFVHLSATSRRIDQIRGTRTKREHSSGCGWGYRGNIPMSHHGDIGRMNEGRLLHETPHLEQPIDQQALHERREARGGSGQSRFVGPGSSVQVRGSMCGARRAGARAVPPRSGRCPRRLGTDDSGASLHRRCAETLGGGGLLGGEHDLGVVVRRSRIEVERADIASRRRSAGPRCAAANAARKGGSIDECRGIQSLEDCELCLSGTHDASGSPLMTDGRAAKQSRVSWVRDT